MYNQNDEIILKAIKNHKENVFFDEKYFLNLLKNSLSLGVEEKKKVLLKIPELTQNQINQLIDVFLEERDKFEKISNDDSQKLKLIENQEKIWKDLVTFFS